MSWRITVSTNSTEFDGWWRPARETITSECAMG
jgi:hypothetical protein